MRILETEQERKSFILTLATFAAFLLIFFLLKFANTVNLSEFEGGGGGGNVAVNFGDSEFGSGDNFENTEPVRSAAKPSKPVPVAEDEIIVSENDDAPVVKDIRKPVKPVKKPDEPVKPAVKPAPKPSKAATSAIDDLLSGADKSGDGDDKIGGNKGKPYGSTGSTGYDGGGGSGTGSGGGNGSGQGIGSGSGYGSGSGGGRGSGVGNYQLAGRKVLSKPQPRYTCNEQGTVVVEISVNASGTVTAATAGVRGTNNTAQCLLEQAKIAAMNTKFDANAGAPEKQVGKIIYNFKLSE